MRRLREVTRSSRLVPLMLAVALIITMGWTSGKPFGEAGEPSFLIKAGSDFDPRDLLPDGTKIFAGTGYDGQFVFYLAQDPLLRGDLVRARIDNAPYRQQRILLPLLGYVLSGGGDPDVLQWALPAINLFALLLAGWFLAGYLRERGLSPWLSGAFLLSFGVLSGVLNDLGDPLAASLFVGGALCWIRNRTAAALLLFTATCLTRETYLIAVGLVMVVELVRFRRRALPWISIPILVGLWAAYVQLYPHADTGPQQPVTTLDPIPFHGVVLKMQDVARGDIVGSANWEVIFIAAVLMAWGLFVARSWAVLAQARRRRAWPSRTDLIAPLGLATLALVPFLGRALWQNPLSYSRYAAAAPAILIMLYAQRRDRAALGLALLILIASFLNPYYTVVPTRKGPVITAIGG